MKAGFIGLILVLCLSSVVVFGDDLVTVVERSSMSAEAFNLVNQEAQETTVENKDVVAKELTQNVPNLDKEVIFLERDANSDFFNEHPDATSGSSGR